ncbi:hypothetical protein SAMN05443662_0059 [Sulfurivirga caldicuralii]|uniref:Transposase, Mutator family n=1 Tax=Sulfurivirga caldicuralii TaxID=364032 RepID=A0A1N6DDG1_9GAMM|nr:hypothetical protein SAMN05443662_0059 [Sulfurivirga caldicuralii]
MAEYKITVNDTLLSNLLTGDRQGLGELVGSVLNQVLKLRPKNQGARTAAGCDQGGPAGLGH